METERLAKLDSVLRDSTFRYVWCDSRACACSGCVNGYMTPKFEKAGVPVPTKEEWLEWTYWALIEELGEAKNLLEQFTNFKQQKKIPTLSEYRERLSLIDAAKAWLKKTPDWL